MHTRGFAFIRESHFKILFIMFCLFLYLFCVCMYRRSQNAYGAQRTTCIWSWPSTLLMQCLSCFHYLIQATWPSNFYPNILYSPLHRKSTGLAFYVTTSSFFFYITFRDWPHIIKLVPRLYQTPNTFLHVFSKPCFSVLQPREFS